MRRAQIDALYGQTCPCDGRPAEALVPNIDGILMPHCSWCAHLVRCQERERRGDVIEVEQRIEHDTTEYATAGTRGQVLTPELRTALDTLRTNPPARVRCRTKKATHITMSGTTPRALCTY